MNGEAIFCVDGGGTKSRARLVDAAGNRLAEAQSGPCNPATDTARAVASLNDLWARCAGAGIAAAATVLAIGAAGSYVASARARLLAASPAFARSVTMSDGYAALMGAGGGKPCSLIIVGTGVAGHRLYADRTSVQRDAWGWVGGDRGSGAWMGRKALRHALAAVDGIAARDELSDTVIAHLGGPDRLAEALVGIGPERLAALVPSVLTCADRGVASARRIRARAIEHLAALARVLDPSSHGAFYLSGGLAPALAAELVRAAGRSFATPEADAMAGCYLVATGRAPAERVAGAKAPEPVP